MRRALATLILLVLLAGAAFYAGCDTDNPKNFKVGFAYPGLAEDGGLGEAQDRARLRLGQELGVTTLAVENVPTGEDCRTYLEELVKQGCKVIFAGDESFAGVCGELAEKNPGVVFEVYGGGVSNGKNLGSYAGRLYQCSYMTGIAAGFATKENKIGYVAAFRDTGTVLCINAFALGAQYVNPDATVQVIWTGQRYDPQIERAYAELLLDAGCDVMAQGTQTVQPVLAAEATDAFSAGCHSSMSAAAPKGYLTSPVWDWGPFAVSVVKSVMEKKYQSQVYWGGLETGVIALDAFGPSVEQDTKDMIGAVAEEIKLGARNVFSGPVKDREGSVRIEDGEAPDDGALSRMDWFVHGVVEYAP